MRSSWQGVTFFSYFREKGENSLYYASIIVTNRKYFSIQPEEIQNWKKFPLTHESDFHVEFQQERFKCIKSNWGFYKFCTI